MKKPRINKRYKRFRVTGMLPGEDKITVLGVCECETDAYGIQKEYEEVFPEGAFDIEYGYFADYLDINEIVRRQIVGAKLATIIYGLQKPMINVMRSLTPKFL